MPNSSWQEKYQNMVDPGEPIRALLQNQHLLPTTGNALDLACGLGANALFLASKGLTCQAWDFSTVALEKLAIRARDQKLPVETRVINLESDPFPDNQFDLILVSHYLYRPLCPAICNALKPGGLLFYQTFCQQKVSEKGPQNPKFLLAENELLELFNSLKPVVYREERLIGDTSQGFRNQAILIAQKPPLES
jgi:SAM-dependent methyltransferase